VRGFCFLRGGRSKGGLAGANRFRRAETLRKALLWGCAWILFFEGWKEQGRVGWHQRFRRAETLRKALLWGGGLG